MTRLGNMPFTRNFNSVNWAWIWKERLTETPASKCANLLETFPKWPWSTLKLQKTFISKRIGKHVFPVPNSSYKLGYVDFRKNKNKNLTVTSHCQISEQLGLSCKAFLEEHLCHNVSSKKTTLKSQLCRHMQQIMIITSHPDHINALRQNWHRNSAHH